MQTDDTTRKRRKALRIVLGVFAGLASFAVAGAFVFALLLALTFSALGWGRAHVSGAVWSALLYTLPPLIFAGAGLLGYSIAASSRKVAIVSIVIWVIVIAEFAAFAWVLRRG